MHADGTTSAELTAYWFMGGDDLTFALQTSEDPSLSPYGLLLWSPDEFVRKESTWLFHPELGLAGTMVTVVRDGGRLRPEHGSTDVSWIDPLSSDSGLLVEWRGDGIEVRERLTFVAAADRRRRLRREIEVSPTGPPSTTGENITVICGLYPNPLLFRGLPVTDEPDRLVVYPQGSRNHESPAPPSPAFSVEIVAPTEGSDRGVSIFERFIQYEKGLGVGESMRLVIEYSPGSSLVESTSVATGRKNHGVTSPPGRFHGEGGDFSRAIAIQGARSLQGIRGVVDGEGRFDASIWQYGYEWGQDAAMVATALSYAGDQSGAWSILENLLDRLVSDEGRVAESSRFRGGDLAELNANGAVLSAFATVVRLSGETERAAGYLSTIGRVGDLVVRASEQSRTGLIEGRRDLWERLPWMGVEEGVDIATNAFVARGLLDAEAILSEAGDADRAARWREQAGVIIERITAADNNSFVDEGRLVHRRLSDGRVARTMQPDARYHDRRYLPYLPSNHLRSSPHRSDPDSVAALPILLGLIPTDSPLVHSTLDHLHRELWNQTGAGGYLRSPLESDPDSPGPWPFVSAWMAEVEVRSGLGRRAGETTSWLLEMAGAAGSWHEYYGPRQSPPFPPVGIIVWGWAQYLLLVIRGWYGIELVNGALQITPRLEGYRFSTTINGHSLELRVENPHSVPKVKGTPHTITEGSLLLSLPLSSDTTVEYR